MPSITLSSKNQITLPVEMVRGLGLKAGDKLIAELIDGQIVLLPQPESWVDYVKGSMKGFWGSAEAIDDYIEELRASPERDEWREEIEDLLSDERGHALKIVEWLQTQPGMRGAWSDFQKKIEGIRPDVMLDGGVFDKLMKLGVIRKVLREDKTEYRLIQRALKPARRRPEGSPSR